MSRAEKAISALPTISALASADALVVDQVVGSGFVTSRITVASLVASVLTIGGLGSMALETATDYLTKAGNLAGLADLAVSRTNLGLGSAALATIGTAGATVPLQSTANTWSLSQTHSSPLFVPAGSAAGAPAYSFTGDTSTGFYSGSAGNLSFSTAGARRISIDVSNIILYPNSTGGTLRLANGTPLAFAADGSTSDLYAYRGGPGIWEQRNGLNAQALRVYNTTDAPLVNYERGTFDWATNANRLTIGSVHAGTGLARPVDLVGQGIQMKPLDGSLSWEFASNGNLTPGTDSAYNIGAPTFRPAIIYGAKVEFKSAAANYATKLFTLKNSADLVLGVVTSDGRWFIGADVGSNAMLTVSRPTGGGVSDLFRVSNGDGHDLVMKSDTTYFNQLIEGTTGKLSWGNTGILEQQMVLDTATNALGIGTPGPAYKLHVVGTVGGVGVGVTSLNTAGDAAFYTSGTVTGGALGFLASISATGVLSAEVRNTNTTAGHAAFIANVGGASAGDPYLELTISGVVAWTIGLDNSDADKLKIGPNVVGTGTLLTLDSGGNLTVTNAIFPGLGQLSFLSDGILSAKNVAGTEGAVLRFLERTPPAAPSADNCYLYAEDAGGGKTKLMVLFASGAAQQIAIEP